MQSPALSSPPAAARRVRRWASTSLRLASLVLAAVVCSSSLQRCLGDPADEAAAAANAAAPVSSPRSQPVADASHAPSSKFTQRESLYIEDVVFGTDSSGLQRVNECPLDLALVWTNTMNTGIYATGVVSHLYSDLSHGKQVVIPGFHRDLNILDHDGHHVQGSPVNMASEVYFHTSPLLVDYDRDGIKDIVWVNIDAEVFVINGDPTAEAAVMDYPWALPKLKLNKRWYTDLAPSAARRADTTPQEHSTPSTNAPPTSTLPPHPPASARRLMNVQPEFESPLDRMRREKIKQHAVRRVVRKLQSQRARTGEKLQTRLSASRRRAGRRLLQEGEDEDEEEEDSAGVEEPVPTPDAVQAAEAHAFLKTLQAKYADGHGLAAELVNPTDAQEKAFLEEHGLAMPEPVAGQVVDDQEPDSEADLPTEGAAEGEHGEEEYEDVAEYEQAAAAAAAAEQPSESEIKSGKDGWIGGSKPDTATIDDYSTPQIQAALDELMAEDPSFRENLESLGLDGSPQADGSFDYSAAIQELAARYGAQQRKVMKRQEEVGGAQLPEVNSSPPSGGGGGGGNSEHIASKEAMLAAERAAEARRRADINSNVVRILDSAKQPRSDDVNGNIADHLGQTELDAYSQVADGLPDEGRESLNLFSDTTSKLSEFDPEIAWQMAELDRLYPVTEHEVWVDAHVLATPVLADLTGDGRPELILSVCYFFDDTDYHATPALLKRLGPEVDIKKYVAGGLVVADLWSHKILWQEHLDLTTDEVDLKAYIYSSPTVVDLDGDGSAEIIVATSLGLIYVFNSATRQLLRGFPLTMHEIQAQVAVADVNQDGLLEMVAMDSKGNVLCFDMHGKELWNALISGFSSQSATFGDVNGDGLMDIVIGTVSGHVWALNGADGKVLPHFPLRTDGRIISPITLVNLDQNPLMAFRPAQRGLHLVFPSFDGHVYVVDGRTGCTNKLDIGEHAYGMVLVDDILGRGKLDLLVTTMNGNVFCFSTEADASLQPLKPWTSQVQGLNGFTARDSYHGIYITPSSKESLREIQGAQFEIEYAIIDERAKAKASASSSETKLPARKYEVVFRFGGTIVSSVSHTHPGVYVHTLAASRTPQYTTIELLMTNEHHQLFTDELVAGMNVHFYKLIKYFVVVPFFVLCASMVLVKSVQPALPV